MQYNSLSSRRSYGFSKYTDTHRERVSEDSIKDSVERNITKREQNLIENFFPREMLRGLTENSAANWLSKKSKNLMPIASVVTQQVQ